MKRLFASIVVAGLLLAISACHSSTNQQVTPNVIGLDVADATAKLKISGMVIGSQTTASSATVPAGDIINQSPNPGTSVDPGTAVNIIVSSGPAASSAAVSQEPVSETAEQASARALEASAAMVRAFSGSVGNTASPATALTLGADGNFYGISSYGGANQNRGAFFRVTPRSVKTVLYSFGASETDAIAPDSALLLGADGNFYGTSATGGAFGEGTVFRVTPAGLESVLWSFSTGAGSGPANPSGGLIQGGDGNFYGATRAGGANGTGVVFRLTPAGALSVLYSMTSRADGSASANEAAH